MTVRELSTSADTTEVLAAQAWRITSGSPGVEELAAVAAVLSAVMSARAAEARRTAEEEAERCRTAAPWMPSAARRRAATSWTASPPPSWKNAA
ncbi:hypothetical protein AB0I77_40025 [Streptomyces sp. NPDC050619]|uniref:hypothetical protein n=1 Tax=Streptomyces sp. NPDC050619 TaxID=3157214 RepID=UPI0034493876